MRIRRVELGLMGPCIWSLLTSHLQTTRDQSGEKQFRVDIRGHLDLVIEAQAVIQQG